MGSSSREEIVEDFDALHTVVSRVVGHSFDALTTLERLTLLERLEHETRRLAVPGHELINQIAEQADETELGGRLPAALADRLRITRGEANRRVAEAADLGPRRALTGEVLAPLLTATATAQRSGRIGTAHVRVIRDFFRRCRAAWTSRPAKPPKPIWPSWPASFVPISSPSWPTGSPIASTPTAISPMRIGPAGAG